MSTSWVSNSFIFGILRKRDQEIQDNPSKYIYLILTITVPALHKIRLLLGYDVKRKTKSALMKRFFTFDEATDNITVKCKIPS